MATTRVSEDREKSVQGVSQEVQENKKTSKRGSKESYGEALYQMQERATGRHPEKQNRGSQNRLLLGFWP